MNTIENTLLKQNSEQISIRIAKPVHLPYERSKRIFDILFSGMAILLLIPLFLLVALLIKLTSKGQVFFRWNIIGQNGRPFTSYKFRTMVENAEKLELDLRKNGHNEMNGVYFKLKKDNRVTLIGKFLRKFSVDELPSFYSVLKGDMSIVGPRPVRLHEYEQLEEWQKTRFRVKPGLTSPWVVNGKNAITDFNDIVELDLDYIKRSNFWYDIKIILFTIPMIIFGRNN